MTSVEEKIDYVTCESRCMCVAFSATYLVGEDQRFLVPASILCGATLLTTAHAASQVIVPGVAVPVGILWYGWTAEKQTHWIVPIIVTSFFGFGFLWIVMPIQALHGGCFWP